MAHDIHLLALDALLADGPRGVTYQHMFVCHGDGSECEDGCCVPVDRKRIAALAYAAEYLLPIAEHDPHANGADGEYSTMPAWMVQRALERAFG